MYMDPARTDVVIAAHRRRMEFADRFGPVLSPPSANTPSRRTQIAAVTGLTRLFQVIGAALRSIGKLPHDSREGLRSNEHDLAAQGIRWSADTAYDSEMPAEAHAARPRRLAAGTITPLPPARQGRSHGTATGSRRASNSEAVVFIGRRLRAIPHAAALGGGGQSGD